MSPEVLLSAAPPIPAHVLLALLAIPLGLWQFAGVKGTARHRAIGWLFVAIMAGAALSGLFIHTIQVWGKWSPIHLLIPVTLLALVRGVLAARRGETQTHRGIMVSLFVLALAVTGGFTLLPGRIMHETVFGVEAGQ